MGETAQSKEVEGIINPVFVIEDSEQTDIGRELNKPTDKPHHLTDENEKPADELNYPTDEHEKPADELNYPTDEHEKPADELSHPTDEPCHPTHNHEKPVDELYHPTDEHEKPIDEVYYQSNEHGERADEYEESIYESDQSTDDYEEPTDESDQSTDKHEEPNSEPSQSTDKHQETNSEPGQSIDKDEEQHNEPDKSTDEPDKPIDVRKENRKRKAGCYNAYVSGLSMITKGVNFGFKHLTEKIIKSPYSWIAVMFFLVDLSCLGVMRFHTKTDTAEIFVPSDTQTITDRDKIIWRFPAAFFSRTADIIFCPKSGNRFKCYDQAKKLVDDIILKPSFEKYCAKKPPYVHRHKQYAPDNKCKMLNPLELIDGQGDAEKQLMESISNFKKLMSNGKIPYYNILEMADKFKVVNRTVQLKCIKISLSMQSGHTQQEILDWEKYFISFVEGRAKDLTCATVYYATTSSLDDAVASNFQSELPKIGIALVLMVLFTTVKLANFSNAVAGHGLLACLGVLSSVLGIMGGYGFTMAIGIPFVTPVVAIPFLVLSIGIDDTFIIVNEFDRLKEEPDHLKRVKLTMQNIGATITMTTLTDIAAFAVSTTSTFPAIRYFSIYAVITFIFEFILQITFFVAFLVLDAKRMQANKRDIFSFQCKSKNKTKLQQHYKEPLSNRLFKKYATLLMSRTGKIVVFVTGIALMAGGIYGCLFVRRDFSLRLLSKDGSYTVKYYEKNLENFHSTLPIMLVKVGKTPYSQFQIKKEIDDAFQAASDTNHFTSIQASWLHSYMRWIGSNRFAKINEVQFKQSLQHFLSLPHFTHFYEDIQFNKNLDIEAYKVTAYMKKSKKWERPTNGMIAVRKIFLARDITLIPYNNLFIFFEQSAAVLWELMQNTLLVGVMILVMTLPFCIHPLVICFLLLNFVFVLVELIGLMFFWSVSLNLLSMINLLMAVGFSMDYSAHVAHSFIMSKKETPNERVIDALSSIGVSVLMGGITSFIGIFLLAFSISPIMVLFFRLTTGIIVFGLFNGLAYLPVILSIFGAFITSVDVD